MKQLMLPLAWVGNPLHSDWEEVPNGFVDSEGETLRYRRHSAMACGCRICRLFLVIEARKELVALGPRVEGIID